MRHCATRCTVLAATLLLASACTTNPYTGERQISKTAAGAAIGATAGAAIGALTGGDRGERALIGAGAGAVAGGAIGGYMDVQEAKLRRQLEGTGVGVTRDGDELILNMPGNVTFATDSASIRSDFYDVLNSVVLVLQEYDRTAVAVEGHTDSSGEEPYNQRLSERRAGSVGSYLASQGVSTRRISTLGLGEKEPVANNSTPNGRSQNRRVELHLFPPQG